MAAMDAATASHLSDGCPQDLGDDFKFERDPLALASILNDRGLTPRLQPNVFQPTLTPASTLPKRLQRFKEKFDFFEGKNGVVFYRPSSTTRRRRSTVGKEQQEQEDEKRAAFRGMKRGIRLDVKPKRIMPLGGGGGGGGSRGMSPTTKSHTPFRLPQRYQTEKKLVPFMPPPHRQSISERKAIPGLEERRWPAKCLLPKPVAKKALNFQPGEQPPIYQQGDTSFEFAKPLSPPPPPQPQKDKGVGEEREQRSMVDLILMREGLMGLPRESLSSLLRQSLSKTELMRMFEDDSTESFEALERRLKTPKKAKLMTTAKANVQQPSGKEDSREKADNVEASSQAIEETSEELHDVNGTPGLGEVSLLERSASMFDLRELCGGGDGESGTVPEPVVLLSKSTSQFDLRDECGKDNIEMSSRLQQAVEAYQNYARQREEIETKMRTLMEESQKRKQKFKLAWGVSPRQINSLRSMKTVITSQQQVSMSAASDVAEKYDQDIAMAQTEDPFSAAAEKVFSPMPLSKAYLNASLGINDDDDDDDLEAGEEQKEGGEENRDEGKLCFSLVHCQSESVAPNDGSSQDANFDEVEMEMTQMFEDSFSDCLKEQPRKRKSVRFLNATPKKLPSPSSAAARGQPMIQVNLPVHVAGKSANISFNESRQFLSTSLHAPTPRHAVVCEAKREGSNLSFAAAIDTPMALRNISTRAQEELEMLYAEPDLMGSEESYLHDARGTIDFDDSA